MRKIIAALHTTLDGCIEGPNGELDWIESWEDPYDLLDEVDTCVLGAGMYPGYKEYWTAIVAAPDAPVPFSGKRADAGELAYARWADRTPHWVLSTRLRETGWKAAHVVGSVDEIRKLKDAPGKAIYALGGAALVSSLMNAGLVDELRLWVHPLVLGPGKRLFKDVAGRHVLKLRDTRTLADGTVGLTHDVIAA